jgi:hypothetical protein
MLGAALVFRAVPARVVAGLVALSLALPGAAVANGDPASDILLQQKVYFPVQRVSPPTANRLQAVVREANAKGYPIRVALIEDANDLGTVPDLLNQPQRYADFLGPEIRFVYKGDLLVVMPDGLGVAATDATPAPARAIEGMQVEAGGTPDGLAQTAAQAVAKLSAAAGHPLEQAKKGGSGGGGAVVAVVAAAVLVGLGIAGAFWVRRSQGSRPAEPAESASGPADAEQTAPQ